jgi:hypothetical protein
MDEAKSCVIAEAFLLADMPQEAARYFERAREVGKRIGTEHGFSSVECRACLGLAQVATMGGRDAEAVELLQQALAAASLNKQEDSMQELAVLSSLTNALFKTHAIQEVEKLLPRYQEAAMAESRRKGLPTYVMDTLYANARLHEVRNPFRLLGPCFH